MRKIFLEKKEPDSFRSTGRRSRARSLDRIYTFGPTLRRKFWHAAPCGRVLDDRARIAFADLHDNMELAEDMVKYMTTYILNHCAEDLSYLQNMWIRP